MCTLPTLNFFQEAAKDTSEQLQPLDLPLIHRSQNTPAATKALLDNSMVLTIYSASFRLTILTLHSELRNFIAKVICLCCCF